jgi:hypothetical protein
MGGKYNFKLDTSKAVYSSFFKTDFRRCWKPDELTNFENKDIGEFLASVIKQGGMTLGPSSLPATTLYICFEKHERKPDKNIWYLSIVYDYPARHFIYKVINIKLIYWDATEETTVEAEE